MKNQFVYTETVTIPGVSADVEKGITGTDSYDVVLQNSFNVEKVIRTLQDTQGVLRVLLDDLHERVEDVKRVKNNKTTIVREKNTYQSEIFLSKGDAIRFLKLTNIETK